VASNSYINPFMLSIEPGKKRKHHSEGMKDVKRQEINNEGYAKEIGSGTDETGYGENDKDKAPWMKNLHQFLSGPDSMNPDMKNMPGNPYYSYTSSGYSYYGMIRRAVIETVKEKVRNALDRAKKEGIIDKDQSIFDVKIDIPGVGPVTYDQLTEAMAEKALKILNKMISEKHKTKSEESEGALGSDKLPDLGLGGLGNVGGPGGSEGSSLGGASEGGDPAAELDEALNALQQLNASFNLNIKTGKGNKQQFPISGETDEKHKKRKMVEQLSKDEEEEVEFYKTQHEPNLESKPYIQDGNGNTNPEQAFANDPMWNNVYMWMG